MQPLESDLVTFSETGKARSSGGATAVHVSGQGRTPETDEDPSVVPPKPSVG